MKRGILITLGSLVGLLFILTLRPIDTSPENASSIEAIVADVLDLGGPGDITFCVQGSETEYYINRGTQFGLRSDALKKLLIGKVVTIYFADHFTPLDPYGLHRHIVRIDFNGNTLFDENNAPHYFPVL
ncbi:MAG: hypothetical protein RLP15_13965 [Cryomorphaceae bacterium]